VAPVDPAAVATWSASPSGHAFMQGSGDGWRDAAIESGLPRAEAEDAAKRTLEAYTGLGDPA
jgi:hypothetical protein